MGETMEIIEKGSPDLLKIDQNESRSVKRDKGRLQGTWMDPEGRQRGCQKEAKWIEKDAFGSHDWSIILQNSKQKAQSEPKWNKKLEKNVYEHECLNRCRKRWNEYAKMMQKWMPKSKIVRTFSKKAKTL